MLFASPTRARTFSTSAEESTRPGSECGGARGGAGPVIPVIEGLRQKTDKLISIDTRKAEVMRRAAAAGAGHLERRLRTHA